MKKGNLNAPRSAASANKVPLFVLADANVLFGPRLRDILMYLHEQEIIYLFWTTSIEKEWVRNVIQKQGADIAKIAACTAGMRNAVPGWEVKNFKKHEARFAAVDDKDRHVAAAAFRLSLNLGTRQRVALITNNITHFPQSAFVGTNVTCYSADHYLTRLQMAAPQQVLDVLEFSRAKLLSPKLSRTQYIAVLVKNRCQGLAEVTAAAWDVPCPVLTEDNAVTYIR
nr:hypothetical protein [uncultured Noviherbaspirillum sp.]